MSSLNLYLPIKAYSLNNMFYGNRHIKKTEARNWEIEILHYISSKIDQDAIKAFTALFDPKKHGIVIKLTYYYPKAELITKAGTLSSKSFDLSNVEKPLIDVLMLAKYSDSSITNLEIDDKFIVDLESKKRIGNEHSISVNFQLVELESYFGKI